jgi:serine/threonine protein kinase
MIRETTDRCAVLDIPLTFGPYTYVRTLGTGSSSVVVLAKHSGTGALCACKVLSRASLADAGAQRQFARALEAQRAVRDPLIVDVRDVLYTASCVIVAMEYC